jgi:hypothetical protein
MYRAICIVSIFIFFVVTSCSNKEENIPFTSSFSTYNIDDPSKSDSSVKGEAHYGVLTPIEICDIFGRLDIQYNNTILNPVSNGDLYLNNAQAAINTGVYGVDLGYLKLFGMSQEVIDYMVTIKNLSDKLGIPDDLLLAPITQVQDNIGNTDTITYLMQKAYNDIDQHLRQSGRESTVGLIIMGGWIEAMYLATQLAYDPLDPDAVVIQKIAEQKYTLTSLLSFLKNYYDDPVVVYYTKKLKYLKNYFDQYEIYFEKGDLEIDYGKQVLRSSGANMTITEDILEQIIGYIHKLRSEVTFP